MINGSSLGVRSIIDKNHDLRTINTNINDTGSA